MSPLIAPVLIAYLISLLGKIITYSIHNKRLTLFAMLKDGGMPSSHTAFTVALTTAIFVNYGQIPAAWVSLAFTLIVMKDAIGVRWQTGQQAIAINTLIHQIQKGADPVKEILGHTPFQVAIGALIGIVIPLIL